MSIIKLNIKNGKDKEHWSYKKTIEKSDGTKTEEKSII